MAMRTLFLTPDELEQLTGRKRGKEQREALERMGIRWKDNEAGQVLVGRRHVEEVFCGSAPANQDRKRPNIGALGA
ncbi:MULTISPECIES: DUF4224 domain-containing protein [Halomonadaceae]|uniref:DUF4224 domain-containing protein n=1 Tax=Halomonadaceae TaxID=28256 RepID=UPI0015979AA4|nr:MULTISPECIES: DUF4224 domain-containing protein [Halomonas]QJQ93957.1 DUF4224 domain-containing protein [Halomonas sp. PA5]